MSPQEWIQMMHLGLRYHRNSAVLLPWHPACWYAVSLWLITDGVNFNHLMEGMCFRFSHCRVTLLPFAISQYFVGRYFETTFLIKLAIYSFIYSSVDS